MTILDDELRDYIREARVDRGEIRRSMEKVVDHLNLHEQKDVERHQEVKDGLAGLNARIGIAETRLDQIEGEGDELKEDLKTGRFAALKVKSSRPPGPAWWQREAAKTLVKVLIAAALGFSANHVFFH